MKTHHHCQLKSEQIASALRVWYASVAGTVVLEGIQRQIDSLVPQLFGYYALQIGQIAPAADFFTNSRVLHHFHFDIAGSEIEVFGQADALPFQEDSLDLVVVLHTLEFADDPHKILREIYRVLIPEGHVIIVGFNPFSLYGLGWLIRRRQNRVPWCGRFYSVSRLKDWLSLLGFETLNCHYSGYRPPINRAGMQKRMRFFEKLDTIGLPYLGGVSIIMAQKRMATLTPIRPRWRPQAAVLTGKLAEPSTREARRDRTG